MKGETMDGYVLTLTGREAIDAFRKPGVRHVAVLDTGEGFVAFDGEVPCAGQVLEVIDGGAFWPFMPKIRRTIEGIGSDIFGKFDSDAFRALDPREVVMASMVRDLYSGDEFVLAVTRSPRSAWWSAQTLMFLDIRVPQPAGV